jgi:transcriptional regulator with XRE-family HTH domain
MAQVPMKNFGQLLNDHVQQLGIADAELARAIGVSRQTIFRWREGLTGRPRRRQDVLAIAEKLRLTADERDTLLLAAGFRPEQVLPPDGDLPATVLEVEETNSGGIPRGSVKKVLEQRSRRAPPIPLLLAGGALLVVLLLWAISVLGPYVGVDTTKGDTPTVPPGTPSVVIEPAGPGEILIVVSRIGDTPQSERFSAALVEALGREIRGQRLADIRLEEWDQALEGSESARELGQALDASLVIHGEFDGGQAMVQVAYHRDATRRSGHASAGQVLNLSGTTLSIAPDRPLQIRALALISLGQLFIRGDKLPEAIPPLAQASNTLQEDGQAGAETWSLTNGVLCYLYALEGQPEQALPYCQHAVETDPQPAFLTGRGLTYALLDDDALAIADLEGVAAWLEGQAEEGLRAHAVRYRSWIETLQAGRNPFGASQLERHRSDLVSQGLIVCDATCQE